MSHREFGKYRDAGKCLLQKAAQGCQREQMDCVELCRLEDVLLSPRAEQLLWNMSHITLSSDGVVTVQEAAEPFPALSSSQG